MNFLGRTFRIGRFLGINVHIHILFILYFGWQLLEASRGGAPALRFALFDIAVIFGIVLVHEYGHCLGARSVGGDAQDILLWPLGGIAFAGAPMTPWAQFVTVACGPLVNVLICVVTAAILIIATGSFDVVSLNPFGHPNLGHFTASWQLYVSYVYELSYYLFLFNMLPVYPMDGGQLFRAALWPSLGLNRATMIAAQVGVGGAVVFGLLGLMNGRQMLVVIAIWGGMSAFQAYQQARYGLRDDRFLGIDHLGRSHARPRGFWSRIFTRRAPPPDAGPANPNPGGWERKIEAERSLEREVDRILAKVHEQGMHSLTYVERQTLERATRERQRRDREANALD